MKIRINLLPYREARRKEAKRQFWILYGCVAGLAVGAVVMVHGVIGGYISAQQERNDLIAKENTELDKKIEQIKSLRENIESAKAQQAIIERLQSDRAAPVQILDQMVQLVPDGMYLRALRQTNDEINVNGLSQSSDLVSRFMLAIQSSPYISAPELVEIKAVNANGKRLQEFSLKFRVRAKPAADSKAPVANAAASAPAIGASGAVATQASASAVVTAPAASAASTVVLLPPAPVASATVPGASPAASSGTK